MISSVAVPSAPPIAALGSTNKIGTVGLEATHVKDSLEGVIAETRYILPVYRFFIAA